MTSCAPALYSSLETAGAGLGEVPLHLAIGMFDGVHLGHQAVIESAVRRAHGNDAQAGVLTFDPHPSRLFRPAAPTRLLLPREEKVRRLAQLGVDVVITQPFDPAFASLTAESFAQHLRACLPGLRGVFVGENFRFGKGRLGTVSHLVQSFQPQGVQVYSTPRLLLNGEPISSSRIRQEVEQGAMAEVMRLLGEAYCCTGPVVSGKQLGRTIGFPTLNLSWAPELSPPLGVYAGLLKDPARPELGKCPAVANYGLRPTVESAASAPMLEIHALASGCSWPVEDYGPGSVLAFEWHAFLRPEQAFDGVEALRVQISRDCERARELFGSFI